MRHVIRTFVLHVSIARPLGESGKLQLTSDMTELEFALDAFMKDPAPISAGGIKKSPKPVKLLDAVGEEYRMLRALRCVSGCVGHNHYSFTCLQPPALL